MIRVLLADDHAIVRMGLRAVLDSEEDITIVGEADTADDAVRAVENAGPDIDVVLMDLRFGPGQSGRELETGASATARIRKLPDPPNVLVVTNYDTDVDILGAIEAGAVGYLLKDAPPAELISAVRAAATGATAGIVDDVLWQGPDVVVVEPPALRARIVARLEGALG